MNRHCISSASSVRRQPRQSALERVDELLEEAWYAERCRLLYKVMFGEELEKSGPVKLPQITTNGH
jgi:hypothetical protein